MMKTSRVVNVAITSDLLCPWCWVGLRNLQQAAKEANVQPAVTWKPFMLRPNAPEDGIPKDGTPQSRVPPRLRQAGAQVGIDFTGLTDRTPNTELFHATMKHLQNSKSIKPESVTEFQEKAFEGYFTLGVYPDKEGLLKAAKNVADQKVFDHVANLFGDDGELYALRQEVASEANEASYAGISGVPTFWFGGKPVFSGAQPATVFARYIEKNAREVLESEKSTSVEKLERSY